MRKLIAAINMTLDGFCDHTAVIADEELHQHYADLLKSAGIILYGRITYQLMEYWRDVVKSLPMKLQRMSLLRSWTRSQKLFFPAR
jgi:dihydrofolate reductase